MSREPRPLKEKEIDTLLAEQLYAHLGCTLHDGQLYIVPITYAAHEDALYAFSFLGQKIDALRQNPRACVQVEQCISEGSWQSVIVWGTYEELTGDDRAFAMKLLFQRLADEHGSATSPLYQPPHGLLLREAEAVRQDPGSVFFRIRIEQRTGRLVRYD